MTQQAGEIIHPNADRLVRMETKLDIVLDQHKQAIEENKVTASSAHNRIDILALQINTHEVKIAQLWEKSIGAFGKFMMGVSGMVGVGGLITVWLK